MEEANNNKAISKEIALTNDQLLYINSLIPKGYLITPSTKASRQTKDTGKIKNLKTFVEEEDKESISKSQKNILDKFIPETKRQRTNKSVISLK